MLTELALTRMFDSLHEINGRSSISPSPAFGASPTAQGKDMLAWLWRSWPELWFEAFLRNNLRSNMLQWFLHNCPGDSNEFQAGSVVQVKFGDLESNEYGTATIKSVNTDGTFCVKYSEGDEDFCVPSDRITIKKQVLEFIVFMI